MSAWFPSETTQLRAQWVLIIIINIMFRVIEDHCNETIIIIIIIIIGLINRQFLTRCSTEHKHLLQGCLGWIGELRSVSTTRVHGPSSRAELTARELGCIFWHPSTRAVNSGSGNRPTVYGLNTVQMTVGYSSQFGDASHAPQNAKHDSLPTLPIN